jgi:hypothetical protein
MNDDPRLGIGGNNPPDPLEDMDVYKIVDPALMIPLLERNFPELIARRDEFVPGIQRWIEAHSEELDEGIRTLPVIVDDEDLKDALDFLRQLQGFYRVNTGEVEVEKRKVKESLRMATAAVEGWFTDTINEPVRKGATAILAAYTTALKDREVAAQKAKDAEAAAAREAAQRLAEMAAQAASPRSKEALLDGAAKQEQVAQQAEAAARAGPELSRIKGNMGTTGSLRTTWSWEKANLMELLKAIVAGKESIDLVTTNDTIITALVRGKDGRRTIPGLNIFQKKTGGVR